jgi:hypothetical protein
MNQKLKLPDLTIDENALPSPKHGLRSFDCDPTWTWEELPNTQVFGGKGTDATTLSACQSSCITYPGCSGVDWSPEFPVGQKCWLTGSWCINWSNGTAQGVTHYVLTFNCIKGAPSSSKVSQATG